MTDASEEQVLRALDPLVGDWTLKATGADGTQWPGGGRQTFEWHESGAHLVGRSTVDNPAAPDSLSIIGCDGQHGTYYQLYSDERGIRRIYRMEIGDGVWTLQRDAPPFGQRFTGTFSDDGNTINGRWEMAEDGKNFKTDFDLTYRRVTP